MRNVDRPHNRTAAPRGRAVGLLCAMALVLGSTAVHAQWLEKVIYLPDSLSGVLWPSCMAGNPDAHKVYVSGRYDGRTRKGLDTYVIVVDADSSRKVARIRVQEAVTSLCYNPVVGKLYATHHKAIDGGISVIDGVSDSVVSIIPSDSGPALLCCNTVNGKMYVSSDNQGNRVTILDGTRDSAIGSIPVAEFIWSLTFDSLGNKLYCAYDTTGYFGLLVIDGDADTVVADIPVPFTVKGAVVSRRHRRLYCIGLAGDSLVLAIIDTDRDTVESTLPAGAGSFCINELRDELYFQTPGDTIVALDCSGDTVARKLTAFPGGAYLLCLPERDRLICLAGGSASLLDLATGNTVAGPCPGFPGSRLMVDQTESKLYCADYWNHSVAVLDASTDSLVQSAIPVGSEPWMLCVAAKANKVYVGDAARGSVYSVDCAPGSVKEVRLPGKEVRALCYDPLDNKVYCASAGAGVHVIDCVTDSVIAVVSTGSMPKQMVYVPQRDRIYVANTGSITAIDCRNDSTIRTVQLHGLPQYPLYNPERDEVLVPCPDYDVNYVAVVDCSTNTWVDTLMYPTFVPVYCKSVKKIYMLGVTSSDLVVLDAASDSLVATITGVKGTAGAVNETDCKVYAALPGLAPFVAVVDAKADTVTRVITSIFACSVTHDAVNDMVYVTGGTEPGKVFVLDGPTDSILDSIPVLGHLPYASDWNPSDGRVYIANLYSGSISVVRDSVVPGIQDVAAVPRGHGSGTIARQLSLPAGLRQADIYDISGRRVARLGPGLDNIGHLGVGVYFVAEPRRSGATKIVVVR